MFQELTSLKSKTTVVQNSKIDYLWDSAVFFRQYEGPSWCGYMTNISSGTYPSESKIMFLPIIDISPTDPICIYTTLDFVIDQAKSLNIRTPVLTFDQPLWLKATEIANCKSMNVVLILGDFHLMMSFMGSIGSLMKGSGLSEAFSTYYGINAIEHMMSGKAVSRGLRGHFLAASALQTKLMTPLFPNSNLETDRYNSELDQSDTEFNSYNECKNESENDEDIESIGEEYIEVEPNEDDFPFDTLSLEDLENLGKLGQNVLNHPEDPEKPLEEYEVMGRVIKTYECYVDLLQTRSKAVKFWLQYQRYVNVLKSL